jgi:hypothetical protein
MLWSVCFCDVWSYVSTGHLKYTIAKGAICGSEVLDVCLCVGLCRKHMVLERLLSELRMMCVCVLGGRNV